MLTPMSFDTRHSLNSALLRRVRQHSTLTTLFRASIPGSDSETRTHPGEIRADEGENLVKAYLLTGHSTFPGGEPLHVMPEPEDTQRIEKAVIHRAEQSPRPSHLQAHKPAPVTEQNADQPAESQDRSWQLLKRIFRKHQEQTADPKAELPQDSAIQPTLDPQAGGALLTPPGNKIPSLFSRQDGLAPASPQVTNATEFESIGQVSKPAGPVHLPTIPAGHVTSPAKSMGTATTPARQIPTSHPQLGSDAQATPEWPVSKAAQTQSTPNDPVEQTSTTFPQDTPAVTQSTMSKHLEPTSSSDQATNIVPKPGNPASTAYMPPPPATQHSDQRSPELHTLPIDAVWPVQKREQPQPQGTANVLPIPSQFQPGSEIRIPPTRIPEKGTLPPINATLAGVPTGQPTGSQVEVIPPRRPRPTHPKPERTGGREQAGPNKPALEMDLLSEIPQTSLPDTKPYLTPKKDWLHANQSGDQLPDEVDTTSIPPTFQPSTPQVTEVIHSPSLVPTEIGPLPADLWDILKQPQPRSSDQSDAPISPRSSSDTQPTPTDPHSELVDTHPKGDILPTQPPPARPVNRIQRSPARERPDETSLSTSSPSEQAETSQQPYRQLDLDELANRVYLDIKRKLAVEWERSRHRG